MGLLERLHLESVAGQLSDVSIECFSWDDGITRQDPDKLHIMVPPLLTTGVDDGVVRVIGRKDMVVAVIVVWELALPCEEGDLADAWATEGAESITPD